MSIWIAQFAGIMSICVAVYFGLLHDDEVPMWYSILFYCIGAVMLLTNLDMLGDTMASHGRLVAALLVIALQLAALDHVRRTYGIMPVIRHG